MFKLDFFFIFFFTVFSNFIFGQSFETIKQFSTADGLPSDLVYTVVQDKNNHYWIATDNGVSKFNGSSFKNYNSRNGLPSNDIFEIKIDKKDRKWLTGYYSGLFFIKNDRIFKVKNSFKYTGIEFVFEKGDTVFFKIPYHKNLYYIKSEDYSLKEYVLKDDVEILNYCTFKKAFIAYDYKAKRNIFLNSKNEIVEFVNKEFYYHPLISDNTTNLFFLKKFNTKGVSLLDRFFSNETYFFSNLGMKKASLFGDNYKVLNKTGFSKYKIVLIDNLVKVFENGKLNITLSNKLNATGYDFKGVHHVFIDNFYNFWIINNDNILVYIPNYFNKIKSYKLDSLKKNLLGIKTKNFIYYVTNDNLVFKYDLVNHKRTKLNINFEHKIYKLISFNNVIYFIHKKGFLKYFVNSNSDLKLVEQVCSELQRNAFIYNDIFYYLNRCIIYNEKNEIIFDFANRNLRFNRIYIDAENYLISNENELVIISKKSKSIKKSNKIKNTNLIDRINSNYLLATNNGLVCLNNNLQLLGFILKGHNIYALKVVKDTILVGSNKGFFILRFINHKFYIDKFVNDTSLFVGNRIIQIESDENKYYLLLQDKIIQIDKNISYNFSPSKLELDFIKTDKSIFYNADNLIFKREENDLDFKVSISSLKETYLEKFYSLSDKKSDKKWKKIDEDELSFKELSPGKYTLSLILMSNDNLPSSKEAVTNVNFEILPYFWETTLFKIVFLILGVLILVLILKFYKAKLNKKNKILLEHYNLELKALKAQMNPHFLFNTLNNLQSVIFLKDELFVNQYFVKFSRLLRNTLDIVNSDTITLYEELNYIKSYIELEKLKFEDNLSFSIESDTNINLSQIKIPVMFVQPFVENAIIHGYSDNLLKKVLKIKIIKNDTDSERIHIIIEDNGKGYKEQATSKSKHVSYGSSIIKNRIKIFNKIYSTNFDFNIQNLSQINSNLSGTRVILKIPINY